MARQHTVYCGVYQVASVRDVLLDVFGSSEEDHGGRVDGDSDRVRGTVAGGRLVDAVHVRTRAKPAAG
ncbi:hypothetical protein [Streptomyces sp. NBC_00057]|uniref:hypothetical protein n=1 Tax=Streptomyces sp. NBC_00057 TaxID=2975634 RepID=UPI00324E55A2